MTGDNTPRPADWYDPGPVKPRRIDPNPRCEVCKSGDPRGRAPMFHPAHKWGRAGSSCPAASCARTRSRRPRRG